MGLMVFWLTFSAEETQPGLTIRHLMVSLPGGQTVHFLQFSRASDRAVAQTADNGIMNNFEAADLGVRGK